MIITNFANKVIAENAWIIMKVSNVGSLILHLGGNRWLKLVEKNTEEDALESKQRDRD